ncbi:MAG: type ISP restriction/modification enzyme [Nostoc sp.]|uniref:type ISP restriction/modification enzyme n=2 Tax=Nostoc sp. TaxID=1180 RepID=UPI002FFC71D3
MSFRIWMLELKARHSKFSASFFEFKGSTFKQKGATSEFKGSTFELSYPGMRERYLNVFDQIWIDCLNGDKNATGKLTPEGKPDPSVFSTEWNKEGITVGTAIALLVRKEEHTETQKIFFQNMWGISKGLQLLKTLSNPNQSLYQTIEPSLGLGLPFQPRKVNDEYPKYPLLTEIFPTFFPGVQTKRDELVVDIERDRLEQRIGKYFDSSVSDEVMKQICPRSMESTNRFNAIASRKYLLKRGFLPKYIVRFSHRPFDSRYIYWEPETKLLGEKVSAYFPHIFNGNIWIVSQKKPRRNWSRPQFIRPLGCLDLMDRGASCIPLFLKPDPKKLDLFFNDRVAALLDPESSVTGVTSGKICPELQVIAIISRVTEGNWNPENDFALTAGWGHTGQNNVTMPGRGRLTEREYSSEEQNAMGEDIHHLGKNTCDIYLNDIAYWKNIPAKVWDYTIGGYQVIKKWLSYREKPLLDRPLKVEEVREVTNIARRITAIVLLETALDTNYEKVKQSTYTWPK